MHEKIKIGNLLKKTDVNFQNAVPKSVVRTLVSIFSQCIQNKIVILKLIISLSLPYNEIGKHEIKIEVQLEISKRFSDLAQRLCQQQELYQDLNQTKDHNKDVKRPT